MKSYNQSRFRRVLAGKSDLTLKKDNTDVLVYLVYVHYLSKLGKQGYGEAELRRRHAELMRRFRG